MRSTGHPEKTPERFRWQTCAETVPASRLWDDPDRSFPAAASIGRTLSRSPFRQTQATARPEKRVWHRDTLALQQRVWFARPISADPHDGPLRTGLVGKVLSVR